MEVTFTRKTGFYAMGSPITLRIDQRKISLNHNQTITLDLKAPFMMQASFFWLKSPVYHVTEPGRRYIITMNLLLLQIYPFLFLFSGITALVFQSILYNFMMVFIVIGFFFYIKNQAYTIKEEQDEKL
ncbi:hypothetical protein A5844_000140 [Enterococcus sp. 10A9_DIV0425]|uniref:Uncharacterized protein n=1 Tax=Candidatus Enterococcus wittei TaxID=1987383 RepID=A0A2C9XNZ4_9ENTE|nr:hypothetical protein [Enterococcus sp. 10A9_DIV0425]OTP11925.1 hypothetical protein A5844_000140 [Enterococcus sp. 10A9_DIV0425]THE15986.1 hypothetical protein E1H99_01185 [Enterococcus hirae]